MSSRVFSSLTATTRSGPRSKTLSTSTFFVPPTFATLPTRRGGWVQYRVRPTTRLPTPKAKRASVRLGTKLTMRPGSIERG